MLKKYIVFTFALCFMSIIAVFAEGEEKEIPWYERGKVYGRIFANVHSGISGTEDKAFEAKRAYFGYKTKLDDNFSANIKLDIGNQNDIQDYAAKKRFAYFKNAYVQYKYEKFSVQFGIADSYQFKVQEKFWGYRYIEQSLQDKHKFGSSADLGAFANYNFSDNFSADASFSNGEGYSNIQQDDYFKASLGVTYKPIKALVLRAYVDSHDSEDAKQFSLASFVGVTTKYFTLGSEYNHQLNTGSVDGLNKYGVSFYSTVKIIDKFNVFARYDYLASNTLEGDEIPWNLAKDGSSIITGCEYQPKKFVKLALNYRDWIAYASNGTDSHYIYFNVELNF